MKKWKLLQAVTFYNRNGISIQGAINDFVWMEGDVFKVNGNRIILNLKIIERNPLIYEATDVFAITNFTVNQTAKKITMEFTDLPALTGAQKRRIENRMLNFLNQI